MRVTALVLAATAAAWAWTMVPIDTAGTAGRGWWTSMEVQGDTIHVAYAVHTSSSPLRTEIRYARSNDLGRTWAVETVDSAANYGSAYALLGWWRGGLGLDTQRRPHIAYTVEASIGSFCTRARRLAPGNWKLDTVEMRTSQPLVCHDADLKMTGDFARIVYTHYGVMTRYAVETDSGWTIRDLALGRPYGVGLALDSAANPHVAVGTLSDVNYAYSSNGGSSWLTERLDSGWWHVDIALDENDRPFISYIHTNVDIRFGRRSGPGNWFTTLVDAGGPNCCRPVVFYREPARAVHLAYYPQMSGTDLKHGTSTDAGSNWTKEIVGTPGSVYSSCSAPDYVETAKGRFIAGQIPGYKLGIYYEHTTAVAEGPAGVKPGFHLSPNPARNWVFIRLHPGNPEPSNPPVSIFDPSGRLVRSVALPRSPNPDPCILSLDIRDLDPGVYVVRIGTGLSSKLVVQH